MRLFLSLSIHPFWGGDFFLAFDRLHQSALHPKMVRCASLLVASLYFVFATATLIASSTAATVVPIDNTTYFKYEAVQLTDDCLSALDNNTAALFQFGDTDVTDISANLTRRSSSSCRIFPGDKSWPSDFIWNTLNWVLGNNALTKSVPLASPCYYGFYYNQAKCAALTANWTNSYLQ